ncbi:MAG: amidohydrolase family protein, partial [Verrucomicrobia bacterium]|nr:amidohydrolase family protein [Verrucomicrobiota bacterium]
MVDGQNPPTVPKRFQSSSTLDSPSSIIRARIVVPIRRAPIEDGAVVIVDGRIGAVGRWRSIRSRFSGPATDLGDSILLPGLINAHCHLDYTNMAGLFPPVKSFCDWIKSITTEKSCWTYSDFVQSWLAGAHMLLRTGTTTVADIEAVPQLLPEVWQATPLRVISFLEMTGVRSRREPAAILAEAVEKIELLPPGRCEAGLSPHAPYSTTPGLMSHAAAAARRRCWRIVTHVAESAVEFEMFRHGRGEMFDWLLRSQRDMSDCGGVSPVQHLAKNRLLGPNLLAVHVNYLANGDAELLARKRVSVVHCPRSHDYFRHEAFPRRTLAKAGVNLCLGTDSLATVRKHPRSQLELNMFLEMRAFAAKHPGLPAKQIIQMATANGACALGLAGKAGELVRGANADLIALPCPRKVADIFDVALHHAGDVSASMIAGQWAIAPKCLLLQQQT